jgi:hypothetical protein
MHSEDVSGATAGEASAGGSSVTISAAATATAAPLLIPLADGGILISARGAGWGRFHELVAFSKLQKAGWGQFQQLVLFSKLQ